MWCGWCPCSRAGFGCLTVHPCPSAGRLCGHAGDPRPSVCSLQVKAEKSSRNLGKLQECSRNVNEMAANVVASTRTGQEQIEEKGEVW